MRLRPSQSACTAALIALLYCDALAAGNASPATADPAQALQETETPLPEELQNLPPTAAGQEGHPDIPLHFVPPNVQALQELGRPGEQGTQSPAENMLPFRF